MASVTEVTLVDDLDGSVAVETVDLSLDGKSYELDLNDVHAAQLRDALAPFVAAARRSGRSNWPARRGVSARGRGQAGEIRTWARDNGFTVSDRGRVPSEVLEAFENRHSNSVAGAPGPDAAEKPKPVSRNAKAAAAGAGAGPVFLAAGG